MARYLVELYLSRAGSNGLEAAARRARSAAEAMARDGQPVRWLRTIYVPEDETCFYLYEAASPDLVRRAAAIAGIPCERIQRATEPDLQS